jgi:transposase
MELNPRERQRYQVVKEYVMGKLSRKQAAVTMGVSKKTVSLLKARYLTDGKAGFHHGLSGTQPVNRTRRAVEQRIVECYQDNYAGFNFTHFYEQIEASGRLYQMSDGEYLSSRSVARILTRNQLVSPMAKRKRPKNNSHPVRPRRTRFGELVQLDASLHDWLSLGSERKMTLHVAIDDATSVVLAGYFCETETLRGYFQLAHQILTNYGIPGDFYTDRRTVFEYLSGKRKEAEHIQFKNACSTLGIDIIATSVPQAKGRVERSFRTHQDRLVSELRLAGIVTVPEANAYLAGYIQRHNQKYALAPVDSTQAFRLVGKNVDLNKVLAVVSPRKILNGNVISFKSRQYQPMRTNSTRLILPVDTPVETVETFDGQLLIRYDTIYYQAGYFADGTLTAHSPPATHPWKQSYGQKLGRNSGEK